MSDTAQPLAGPASQAADDTEGRAGIWHYTDEHSGKRTGPVTREALVELIGADRVARESLVWNPGLPSWIKVGESEFASLFADRPPPLPITEIRRGAIYMLALVPVVGVALQAVLSAAIAECIGMTPLDLFHQRAWLLAFVVANGILAGWDEHNLKRGGLRLPGAIIVGALIVPLYIFASCRTVKRHAPGSTWLAFAPFVLSLLAFAASLVANQLLFDPDAPLVFNPDQWL